MVTMANRNMLWVISTFIYSGCIVALTVTSFCLYYWQANDFCVQEDSKFKSVFKECPDITVPNTTECKRNLEPRECVSTIEVSKFAGTCVNVTGINCTSNCIKLTDVQNFTHNCSNTGGGSGNITSSIGCISCAGICANLSCEQNCLSSCVNTTNEENCTSIDCGNVTGGHNDTNNCVTITVRCNCTGDADDRSTDTACSEDKTTENATIGDLTFLLRSCLIVGILIYFILANILMVTDAIRSARQQNVVTCARQLIHVFLAILFLTAHFGLSIVMIAILKEQPELYWVNVLNVAVELLFLGSPLFFTRTRNTIQQATHGEQRRGRSNKFNCPITKFHKAGWTDEDVCTICLSVYKENERIKTLPCRHSFHSKCIDEWASEASTCPVCRIFVVGGNTGNRTEEEEQEIEDVYIMYTGNGQVNVLTM